MSYQPPAPRTTSALAVVSLIFGIGTWLMLPLIGAIVAIVCGHLARGEISRAPPGSIEGDGLALAGLILGYVHLLLILCVAMLFFGAMIFGFTLWHWS